MKANAGPVSVDPRARLFIYQPTILDKPSAPTSHITVNAGVFVPRDGAQPELYTHITEHSVEKVTPPVGSSCATAVVVREPVSKGVSVKHYAIFGNAAGTLGGLTAHDKVPNSRMRQTVGVGAAGNSPAMDIVGALINTDM